MAGKPTKPSAEQRLQLRSAISRWTAVIALRARLCHLFVEIKQWKASEHFQQTLCPLAEQQSSALSIAPCLPYRCKSWARSSAAGFSLGPCVGSLWGHSDCTRSHLQYESPGQMRWSLGNTLFCTLNLAKYCTSALWKDSSISPETQVLGKSSFLQETMMRLQVDVNANVSPRSAVNICTVSQELCSRLAEHNTRKESGRRSPLTVTTKQVPAQKPVRERDAILPQ